jgi:hypothetical protein
VADVIGWAIWYGDEKRYSSKTHRVEDLPHDDVQWINVYEDRVDGQGKHYRVFMAGKDWYFTDGFQLWGCNNDEPEENRRRYPSCLFLRGKWTTPQISERIRTQAIEDKGP